MKGTSLLLISVHAHTANHQMDHEAWRGGSAAPTHRLSAHPTWTNNLRSSGTGYWSSSLASPPA